jgi:hypothetical protein
MPRKNLNYVHISKTTPPPYRGLWGGGVQIVDFGFRQFMFQFHQIVFAKYFGHLTYPVTFLG